MPQKRVLILMVSRFRLFRDQKLTFVKARMAPALGETLMGALAHTKLVDCVVRRQPRNRRETCGQSRCSIVLWQTLILLVDVCMTSLFPSSWRTTCCGYERCRRCYETVPAERAGPISKTGLSCNPDNEHIQDDFIPVTRLPTAEIVTMLEQISTTPAVPDPLPLSVDFPWVEEEPSDPWEMVIPTMDKGALTIEVYERLCYERQPFRVRGLSSSGLWTPEALSEKYGKKKCMVVGCFSGDVLETTVGEHILTYGGKPVEDPPKLKVRDKKHFCV